MTDCTHRYTVEGEERGCPRPTSDDHDRCPFHLSPDERDAAGVSSAALRTAFLADLDAEDPARREYVDVRLRELDLSSLVLDGNDVGSVTFREVTVEGTLDLSEASFERLRVYPDADLDCRLVDATVGAGSLDQPGAAAARYDLTDATVGDVELDCEPGTFDRYRFYRTRFDGFQFASYRAVLRASGWRLHEFAGDPARTDDVEGLEHTYLAARQGASAAGDSETASVFLVRELRYRRRRYAAHARTAAYAPGHRVDAALRWLTNGFLDLVAGYGERPQQPLVLALFVAVGSALAYPAAGGLTTGDGVTTYASHGAAAVLDGLYFSVVTFATLGLGDVHPAGDLGRFVAASEGLAGAFLTAVFVFSLGRRVTR